MKRNFQNESVVNFLLRLVRAIAGRMRGLTYYYLGLFAKGSSSSLYFDSGLRLINSKSIRLGSRVGFGIMARLECYGETKKSFSNKPLIIIGDNTTFGDYFHAGALCGIQIGENVLGGSNIIIMDHSHGNPKKDMANKVNVIPRDRELYSRGPIVIENNVWIGDSCVILSGSRIGYGSIIGANSIVKGIIEPYSIYTSNQP